MQQAQYMPGPMRERVLDLRGLKGSTPVERAEKELTRLADSDVLKVLVSDRTSVHEFQDWVSVHPGILLVAQTEERDDGGRRIFVHRLAWRA